MSTLLDGNFAGLQHVGVPVTDLERSRAFYARLGFEEVMGKEFPHGGGTCKVAMMRREGVVMELYQLPDDEQAEIRTRGDGAIDHVAFSVADIDKTFADLRAAGLAPLEEAPVPLEFWRRGCKYFAIRGPDGEKLEFNQIL